MYYRLEDKAMIIRESPSDKETTLSLADFSFISSIRAFPEERSVLLTGVSVGDKTPSLKTNYRGNLRLFKASLNTGNWECIYKKYAHDPCPITGTKQIAFHNGNGITVISGAGEVIYNLKLGQFNWGPPSLSSSPGGKRITFIRWRGDDRKICSINLADSTFRQYRPSCFSYSWFDDDHILYTYGSSIKLLDLINGSSRLFLKDIRALVGADADHVDPDLLHIMNSEMQLEYDFGNIKCVGEMTYFACSVSKWSEHRYLDTVNLGLFSINKDKRHLSRISPFVYPYLSASNFETDGRGNIIVTRDKKVAEQVGQPVASIIGPDRQSLNDGWRVLETGVYPEFGFHYLDQCD